MTGRLDEEEDTNGVEAKGDAGISDLGYGWVLALLIVCVPVVYVLVYGYFRR